MRRRLNSTQMIAVPWEIPDIATTAQKAPHPGFHELELGQIPQPEPAPTEATRKPDSAAANQIQEMPQAEQPDPRTSDAYVQAFEVGLKEGREHGYADGFAAGRQVADSQFADQLRRLGMIVQQLGEPLRSLERPVEEAVIALALELARCVVGGEIKRSREHLVRLIREAVMKIPIDVGTPTIVLNPADIELIRRLAPDLETNGVALVTDDAMEPGGCRVYADDANNIAAKDRRWHPGALQGLCEVDLTLASRWRDAMLAMFEGEDA